MRQTYEKHQTNRNNINQHQTNISQTSDQHYTSIRLTSDQFHHFTILQIKPWNILYIIRLYFKLKRKIFSVSFFSICVMTDQSLVHFHFFCLVILYSYIFHLSLLMIQLLYYIVFCLCFLSIYTFNFTFHNKVLFFWLIGRQATLPIWDHSR